MSLILEALRRSEAQRQLGRTPDVLTPMPVLRTERATSNRRWWMVLLGVAVLLAGWMGWRTLHPSSGASDHATQTQTRNPASRATTVDAVGDATITKESQQPMPAGAANTNTAPPAETVPAPSTMVLSQDTPIAQADADVPAPGSLPLRAVANESTTTLPASKSALTAAQINASALPPTIESLPKPHAAISPPTQASATTLAEALLPVNDLPTGERAGLPTLKVSMHVYAEAPADRFMIIDGTRIGEGGRIGPHIVLVTIRKDGGVLDIDGHRVLLPRP